MFEVTREMRLSIKLWFFLPGKLSEVEILCTSRRYLVNYSVNWASNRAAHITMSATLPFVPSDRTFPFHQRNIFPVFPHPPVFTFAFTAKTAMRVKNCHFWKQEQFIGNYNSWQVPQVSFFFWGALKQNQMSSHCNILILKTNIYILHTWAPPRPCPRQSPTYRKFSSSAGLRDSWKEIWWELQKILLSNTPWAPRRWWRISRIQGWVQTWSPCLEGRQPQTWFMKMIWPSLRKTK